MSISDFSSPFVTVALVGEDGRVPLWMIPEEGVATGLPTTLACVESVSIEMNLGQIPTITANLQFNRQDGKTFLESRLVEFGMSHLEVQIGYTGGEQGVVLSPVYTGLLQKPEVSMGEDVTISLKALGLGGYSATRSQSGRTFTSASRFEILEQVVAGSSSQKRTLSLNVDAVRANTSVRLPEGKSVGLRNAFARSAQVSAATGGASTEAYRELFQTKLNLTQGYKSDWAFIWELVRDCRCSMLLHNDVVYMFPVEAARLSKPVRTIRYFDFPGGLEGGFGGLPILGVSSPTSWIYLPQTIKGIVLKGVDRDSLDPVTRLINDAEVKVARTAKALVNRLTFNNPPLDDEGEGGGYLPGNPADPDIIASARAEYDAATDGAGLNLSIETLFDPVVIPGVCVRVEGVSSKHDTTYGVQSLTYTAGSGGIPTMSLECIGNFVAPNIGNQIGVDPFGSVNAAETSDDDQSAETTAIPGDV